MRKVVRYCIYVLSKEGLVFYVGSSKNIEVRFYQHTIKFGLDISYEILESGIIGSCVREREEFWICDYRSKGFILVNKNLIGRSKIKLKSIKIFNNVHKKLKIHVADSEEGITEFVSNAIIEKLAK